MEIFAFIRDRTFGTLQDCGGMNGNEYIPTEYYYRNVKIKSAYPHIEDKMPAIIMSPKFKKWIDDFDLNVIDFKEFSITDVDFFGDHIPEKLGFVKGFGVAIDKICGGPIPAIAFVRGACVSVLIIVRVKESSKKYVLMCKQMRFASGGNLIEACAGMIDEHSRNLKSIVFDEVRMETGFEISLESLIPLGDIRPSGGGCDEIVHLYAWETEITLQEFEQKKNSTYGQKPLAKINLEFIDFNDFDDVIEWLGDVKAECMWRRYLKYCKKRENECNQSK
jgi:hypothetical protein